MGSMPKVTYHEFRPGHWVKLVDGKIVGRATAEEVAAWKREKAEQAVIWQDVVQRAASAEPKPEVSPEMPLPESKKIPTEPVTIWQDVLSQLSRTTPQAERMTREIEATEKAEHTLERVSVEQKPKAVLPESIAKAKPKDVAKVVPAKRAVEIEPTPTAKAAPAKAVATKPVTKAKPKVEQEIASERKAVQAPPVSAVQARQKGTTQALSMAGVAPEQVSPQPLPKAIRTSKAGAPKEAAKRKATGITPEETILSEATPAKAEKGRQLPPKISTRQAKPSSTASQERPNQLYLWIMAGVSDDLIATVRSGLARYQERFHQPAEVVLCHMDDMAILEKANLPVDVRQGKGVPPRNFWIGLK